MHDFTYIRSEADFHRSRKAGIGASDVPVLAGLAKKYGSTPYQLWRVKTGRDKPFSGNDATWWGHVHENSVLFRYVCDHYDRETAELFLAEKFAHRSIDQFLNETEFRHPDYPWALSHPDLVIAESEPWLVQAKSHSLFGAKRDDDDDFGYQRPDGRPANEIPASVYLQEQWEQFTTGIARADVATLINTNDYREYSPLVPSKHVIEQCLALAERFMWHVVHDEPPMPETWADISAMFPEPTDTTAVVGGEEEDAARLMIAKYHRSRAAIKNHEARCDDIKNALGLWVGENKVLTMSDGTKLASTWSVTGEYAKIERIRTELPEVYEDLVERGIITKVPRRELRPAKLKGAS